ncbi:MAG: pentapeptide repeat-containing protein, partial [Symploca sp. SIO1C4]|nr:pentapeptide repeat-containing protein [Symploca sp. SIO1C4]
MNRYSARDWEFKGVSLPHASLRGVNLSRANLSQADLR